MILNSAFMGEKSAKESELADAIQSLKWAQDILAKMDKKLAVYRKGEPPKNGEMTWLYDRSLEVEAALMQLSPVLSGNLEYQATVKTEEEYSQEIECFRINHGRTPK